MENQIRENTHRRPCQLEEGECILTQFDKKYVKKKERERHLSGY